VKPRQPYLAVVNPAAGGGRTRKLLGPALDRLKAGGVEVEVVETSAAGDATRIAREAYGAGRRNFIAVGGDGTSYEVINGIFPQAGTGDPARLGFLPLGTGNSFLRDFSDRGVEHAIESLIVAMCCVCAIAPE
jgi:diacylglycerol kinase (ATP)